MIFKRVLLKLLQITQPTPLQNYLKSNERYFIDNYLDPNFNANQYRGKLNPYYVKYGIKEPIRVKLNSPLANTEPSSLELC